MQDDLPDHKRFEATNRQYFVLAGVGAVFVILLTFLRTPDDEAAYRINIWLTVLFAIITLIGAAAALFRRSWLRLDLEGFESSELRALGKVSWGDVSEFRLYIQRMRGMPPAKQVAFEVTGEKQKVMSRLSGLLFNGTVRLTENYRIKGEELVTLMNAFRERALANSEQKGAGDT